jgi:hypothetical protein
LSSTTESRSERGQVLVLFAGGLVVIFLIAALAFDVGMTLLERRDQQNAADAAALAGARYVRTSANFNGSCAAAGVNAAVIAACDMALANDFDNAATNEDVFVRIPPVSGEFRSMPGHVQVDINATRDSIFAGVIGKSSWGIGATAVAANQPGVTYEFGMIALDPNDCDAIKVSGTGNVNSAGSIQSNSDGSACTDGSFDSLLRGGGGDINVTAPGVCRAVGNINPGGAAGSLNCTPEEFSFALPDPLATLPAPVKPTTATPTLREVVAGVVITPTSIPDYCPGAAGSKAPSEATPRLCRLGNGGASERGRQWILSPGLYPGGIELSNQVTAFLLPGVYWLGGGGFQTAGDASVISVNSETDRAAAVCVTGATPPCTGGGGILIYNSTLPGAGGVAGKILLGGGGATLNLQPYDYPFGSTTIDLVIFQDRTVSLGGDDVTLNGSTATATSVRGIIYLPLGDVKINGSTSDFSMDQVIANTFSINGSGGTINILREVGVDAVITAVGLVQ